jgi:hypothetical protein
VRNRRRVPPRLSMPLLLPASSAKLEPAPSDASIRDQLLVYGSCLTCKLLPLIFDECASCPVVMQGVEDQQQLAAAGAQHSVTHEPQQWPPPLLSAPLDALEHGCSAPADHPAAGNPSQLLDLHRQQAAMAMQVVDTEVTDSRVVRGCAPAICRASCGTATHVSCFSR